MFIKFKFKTTINEINNGNNKLNLVKLNPLRKEIYYIKIKLKRFEFTITSKNWYKNNIKKIIKLFLSLKIIEVIKVKKNNSFNG